MKSKADVILSIFEEKLPKIYKTNKIRQSQVQMALDIAEFLDTDKKMMIIEAPVGTGKSLAALVPTLVDRKYNILHTRNVMYATATINLQGQLENDEIPLLKKLGYSQKTITAKGMSHYYCHYRYKNAKKNILETLNSRRPKNTLEQFFNFSKTGQRSELGGKYNLEIDNDLWKQINMDSNSNCRNCKFSYYCSTRKHRKNFKSTVNQLVITNHGQLIQSLLNDLDSDTMHESTLKTDMGVIIIDEAHEFQEAFMKNIEKKVTIPQLKSITSYIKRSNKKWKCSIKELSDWIHALKKENPDVDNGNFKLDHNALETFNKLRDILNENLFAYKDRDSRGQELEYLLRIIDLFLNQNKYTTWFNLEDTGFYVITNHFKKEFKQFLDYMQSKNKIIFMSGTLTVDSDFSYIEHKWGIKPNEAITKSFDSPFDYKNQALIYIPKGLHHPESETFIQSALKPVKDLLNLTGGRTLLLNTSNKHKNEFYREVSKELQDTGIIIYNQGENSTEALTQLFKENETSVLVGTGSYFSGFSVSGTALTSVILNRLPFTSKDDPTIGLMSQGLSFQDKKDLVIYPMMANKLNQAIGRLIRSINDYGIITILDCRIFQSEHYNSYGKYVQDLLQNQGYNLTREWKDVQSFYNSKLKNGAGADYIDYDRDSLSIGQMIKRNNKRVILAQKKTTNRSKTKKKRLVSQNTNINTQKRETNEKKNPKVKALINTKNKIISTSTIERIILKPMIKSTNRIQQDQKLYLKFICTNYNLAINIDDSVKNIFPKLCHELLAASESPEKALKDFPYKDSKEKNSLKQYLSIRTSSNSNNEDKIIIKQQRAFLRKIAAREGVSYVYRQEVKECYKKLYRELVQQWKDTTYLKRNFPYQDEEQHTELYNFHEGTKKIELPLCTDWGCSGKCGKEEHKKIETYFINTYGATAIEFTSSKRINITPSNILEKEEFRPKSFQ
ncbi:ATP-dependent DNA helicase [Bacillus pretiosus]|uniref:ATP-dependent DNA helicase n=1 Tax=Bacillus pretiosus TaxID=2983392 RepID=UPI003D302E65